MRWSSINLRNSYYQIYKVVTANMKIKRCIIIVIMFVLFQGCAGSANQSPIKSEDVNTSALHTDTGKPTEKSNIPAETGKPVNIGTHRTDTIELMLSGMTIEQKIGQMFICAFRKDEKGNGIVQLNDKTKKIIQDYGIGGVILFSENINSEEETVQYIKDLKKISNLPIFIGIDEEGGRVVRTASLRLPQIPSAKETGGTGDAGKAYGYAKDIAMYLKRLGFNLDFAPIADINSNPNNTVIGDRSFGSDPEMTGEMVASFVKGLEENGIYSTLKHFPGHGDTSSDSHYGLASVENDLDRLEKVEFVPFEMGIEAGASFVMVGHISTPNVTDNYEPTIFSELLLNEILRKRLGFEGIIITDALDMGAVTKYYTSEETSVKAVNAGVDILLMPDSFQEAYDGLLNAVKRGDISEKRIDESVKRILKLKMRL